MTCQWQLLTGADCTRRARHVLRIPYQKIALCATHNRLAADAVIYGSP